MRDAQTPVLECLAEGRTEDWERERFSSKPCCTVTDAVALIMSAHVPIAELFRKTKTLGGKDKAVQQAMAS